MLQEVQEVTLVPPGSGTGGHLSQDNATPCFHRTEGWAEGSQHFCCCFKCLIQTLWLACSSCLPSRPFRDTPHLRAIWTPLHAAQVWRCQFPPLEMPGPKATSKTWGPRAQTLCLCSVFPEIIRFSPNRH